MNADDAKKELRLYANFEKANILQRFFKTGKGQYGEGDIFLGIVVPIQRKIAIEFADITISEIEELINSKIHEKRMIGLFILIRQYSKSDEKKQFDIFNFYLLVHATDNSRVNVPLLE